MRGQLAQRWLVTHERDAAPACLTGELGHHGRRRVARRERIEHADGRFTRESCGQEFGRLFRADERARENLVDARIDLALRAGRLTDSAWVARRLCAFSWGFYAAPAYLRRQPVPATLADLAAQQWLGAPRQGSTLQTELTGPAGRRETLRVDARITSNNQLTLQQMCVAGLGVAGLVRSDADEDLRAGRLVELLPEWRAAPIDIWAVTPQRDNQPAKVRHAIAALAASLRALPGAVD